MKYIIVSLLCFLCLSHVLAQKEGDEVVFKAMSDEMKRSMEQLVMPGCDPAFYISYTGGWGKFISMRGCQGAMLESTVKDDYTQGNVLLHCGDDQNTQHTSFGSSEYMPVQLLGEKNYDAIRQAFWQGTDLAYKVAQQQLTVKNDVAPRLNIPEEEKEMPEWEKVSPVTKMVEPEIPYTFDKEYWENYTKEVSAVFAGYKDIFNSGVYVHGVDLDIYTLTTEGTKLKTPLRYFTIRVGAVVRAADGMEYADSFVETAECPQEMPDVEAVKKQVHELVERLRAYAQAPVMDEEYTGPIMYEGEVMQYFFVGALYASQGNPLVAFRRTEDGKCTVATPGEKLGEEVTNKMLTIKNYTQLKEYDGVKLMGRYEIDGEGVVPAAEMTLIEKGVLKQLLNKRVPTLKAPHSTGSYRTAMRAASGVVPGIVHIQADGGKSPEELKKLLLKTAKQKKLDHAYIIRKRMSPLCLTYRVDVKTGEETLVRSVTVLKENLGHLKKAIAFSKEESVLNGVPFGFPASLIYPSAAIVDNLFLGKIRQAPVPEPALTRPALR